ncbi:hypothetical protein [Lactiplantibacillus plajomi]|uniref:Extracellular protein n=1 Tax=Lactiplantibacillus plajomi TaxID=1457217 RepID=A0ABV6K2R6_9LACO|nr:hypothetical protein [Lactiplantibacillus plajomi]
MKKNRLLTAIMVVTLAVGLGLPTTDAQAMRLRSTTSFLRLRVKKRRPAKRKHVKKNVKKSHRRTARHH